MVLRASCFLARTGLRTQTSSSATVPRLSASSVRTSLSDTPRLPITTWTHKRLYSSEKAPAPSLSASKQRSLLPIAVGAVLLAGGAVFLLTREEPAVIAPDRWTDVKIQFVRPLTPETSLFRLEVPKSLLPPAFTSDPSARPILSLFIKEPNLQIQRAYTPLSAAGFDTAGRTTIDLVIKRYPDGEASRYIHRLREGDDLSVRGPSCTWFYRPQDWDEVVFIVGGTGITPACQLIHDSVSRMSPWPPGPSPAVSVVYASPSPSRILLKGWLDSLVKQGGEKYKVHYLVDSDGPLDALVQEGGDEFTKHFLPDPNKTSALLGAEVGTLDRGNLERLIGRGGDKGRRRVVVVCGPEGMVTAVAGPRGRNFSPGPVGGILRELGYTDREVVKL